MNLKVTSWRTTAYGLSAIAYVAIKAIVLPLLDSDPETVPNVREVLEALAMNGESILLGLGLGKAHDSLVAAKRQREADAALRRTGVQ